MNESRRHFFLLHELLTMAALAALGGVSGSAISWIGASLRALIGLPGGLQFLAGVHVLWPTLAAGLVRKPGAATVTGLLKGAVEFFSGNPHGLIVVLVSGLGGLVVDLVWILMGRRDYLAVYMLAGGLGAASNVLVFRAVLSLPSHHAVNVGLWALAGVAFVSGTVLAGLLAWSLIHALRHAGVAGLQRPAGTGQPRVGAWLGAGVIGVVAVVIGSAVYFATMREQAEIAGPSPDPQETLRNPEPDS
jgi:energy-coupling factor transport system substrate-specific component